MTGVHYPDMIAINASVSYLWSCRLVLQTAWAIVGYYRVVQLNFTPEVFYMLFDRSLSIFSMASLKHHMDYGILQFPVLNPIVPLCMFGL